MSKSLIYTVSFDPDGVCGARIMAKILVSSLLKSLWSGDIIVFRNSRIPLFPVGRPNLEEIFCEQKPWDGHKPEESKECLLEALEWRFKARQFINAEQYDKVIYLDCDSLALRNLDHLFQEDSDILIQKERGRSICEDVFSGYLTNKERENLTFDGINAGTIAVRGSIYQRFMNDWEEVYRSNPVHHTNFRDQTALNRLILDTNDKVSPLERGEVAFPFHIDTRYQDFRKAALLHMVGEGQAEKIDLAYALYMSNYYNDERGIFLDFLEM